MRSDAWRWVPSLYFAEGVPYSIVSVVSVVMLKNLGLPNRELAFWTSLLTLPWVLKPLWAPVIDVVGTKRRWILAMQLTMAGGFALAALLLPLRLPTRLLIGVFMLVAAASATHDAAADGFYLIGLDAHRQALFTGIRSTAYRIAMITAQGLLVMLVGWVERRSGSAGTGWLVGLAAAAGLTGALAAWHGRTLPRVEAAPAVRPPEGAAAARFGEAFAGFFRKPGVGRVLAFLLLYRLGESQLVRLAAPFMLDGRASGGMGISTLEQGFLYGTVGVICLLAGGVLGGWLVARHGLARWIWPMALAINVPDLAYVYLAAAQPENMTLVGAAVACEQFGYGLGFTLYMLVMVAFAEDSGEYRTSHFALMTGFMALGMMLPGMAAGELFEWIGSYTGFFWYVMLCTLPGFAVTALVRPALPAGFGRKTA